MVAEKTGAELRSRPKRDLPSLTGLRFFAALLVFFIHSLQPLDPSAPQGPINPFGNPHVSAALLKVFGPAGYLGVSFFFVLSGFVLTFAYRQGEPLVSFWRRRLTKIFPSHLAVWAIIMVLFGSTIPVITWLPNLFLVNSFAQIPAMQLGVNPPSWSLCAELLFYALFPVFIVLVRRIADNRLWLWAAGMVVGLFAVTMITLYVVPDHPRSPLVPLSFPQMWFNYTFPGTRLFEFVLGMVVARLVMAGRWPRIPVAAVAALVVAGYLGAVYVPAPFNFSLVTAIPFAVLIGATATADLSGARTFLRGRVMVWLGKVSFCFYLAQGLVLFWGRPAVLGRAVYSTPVAILVMVAMFAVTLFAGWVLHTLVEEPAMRRFARSRKNRAAILAARSAAQPAVVEPVAVDGPALMTEGSPAG